MLSNGRSKENQHKGTTRVLAGDLEIDGKVFIGDQSPSGTGYILPEQKGTEGQVLTANADNSTSFQDANGITGRVYKNLYTMIDPQLFYPSDQTPVPVYAGGYGSLDLDINEFPVGATIRLYTEGKFNLASASGAFSFFINDLTFRKDFVVPSSLNSSQSFYHFHLSVQRLNSNEYRFQGSGTVCTSGNTPVATMDWGAETIVPPSPLTFFNIKLTWITVNTSYYPITRTFFVDMILDSSLLLEAPPAPTSHLALTDLNAGTGDGGHINLFDRRGIKSMTGNIDMDGNRLSNVQEINGQGGLEYMRIANTGLFQIDGGEITQTADTNINLYPTNILRLGAGGSNIVINPATEVDLQGGLNMNNNNIDNVPQVSNGAGNLLLTSGAVGVSATLGATISETTTNMFVAVANNAVTIAKSNDPSPPTNITNFSTTGIDVYQDINMNNNNVELANEVSSSKFTLLGTNIESPLTNLIRFDTTAGIAPFINTTQLNMNNGNIVDILNLIITGGSNITLPIVIGTPSGALQVQNGGAYIKQDLQVDGTIYCDNVNGIRPSGGLYSESSGFNIPSATLTETNLLGQGGSAGTLAIPAGGFSQYDSYSFKASGVLSGGSNDVATLRLKSLVNGTTPVELGAIIITLTDNGLVDVAWKVEADFNVRTTGGAGVGVIVLSGNFTYTNNNDVIKTYLRTIVNNTVFDTTQSNELQFTYQNDATNPLTNIRIDQASFTKWY